MAIAPISTRLTPSGRNLRDSIVSMAILVVSAMIGYIAHDVFDPGTNEVVLWVFIGLALFLVVFAGIYAIVSLIKVIRDLRSDRHNKNYAALVINSMVLLFILYQVVSRLMF